MLSVQVKVEEEDEISIVDCKRAPALQRMPVLAERARAVTDL